MTAEKQTVQCPIHDIEFPVSTCLARQKIVAEAPTSGMKGEAYKRFKNSCGGCKIGLELYAKANEKVEIKTIKEERVQAPAPESKTPLESKICRCGVEFFRQPDQNDVSWSVSKYCPECAALTPYYRKKKFEWLQDGGMSSPEQPPKETAQPDDEFKTCAYEECGKKFYKGSLSSGAWALKKYCNFECKKEAERGRERARKRAHRKVVSEAKNFDIALAEEIAIEVTEERLKLIASFVESAQLLDQLKAFAIQASVDAQKRAHEYAWNS